MVANHVVRWLGARARTPPKTPRDGPIGTRWMLKRRSSSAAVAPIAPKVRNVGIMAHIDAGKTTLSERMLYYCGHSAHVGEVHDGNTVMDYMDQERERGITIQSAAISFPWRDHLLNLIDSPGHCDFGIEVERSLRVLDGAVLVLDAVAGVEAQTLAVWRQADHHAVPRIAFVNKMDREGANLDMTADMISEKLKVVPLVLHRPIIQDFRFMGLYDLVDLQQVSFAGEKGSSVVAEPISCPAALAECLAARGKLVDALCDLDAICMDAALDLIGTGNPDQMDAKLVKAAVRRVCLAQSGLPVLIGSALKNQGVQPVLDAVIDFLPAPHDRTSVPVLLADGIRADLDVSLPVSGKPTESPLTLALPFKLIDDRQRGLLAYVRVYSGVLTRNSTIHNASRNLKERISKLYRPYADVYEEVDSIPAGQIGVVLGLRHTFSGDTLHNLTAAQVPSVQRRLRVHAASSSSNSNNNLTSTSKESVSVNFPAWRKSEGPPSLLLEPLRVDNPVFFCTVSPRSQRQLKPLQEALASMQREDPSLQVREDAGSLVMGGMGELHLEIVADRLRRTHGVDIEIGSLQIAYRESITDAGSYEHHLSGPDPIRQIDHDCRLLLTIEPSENDTTDACSVNIDRLRSQEGSYKSLMARSDAPELFAQLTRGIETALARGPILGFPMQRVTVHVDDLVLAPHSNASSVFLCALQATHKLAHDLLSACILEPLMAVSVRTEEAYVGPVVKDLTSTRRGAIHSIDLNSDKGAGAEITASVPLVHMVGYATSLRSLTAGCASFNMQFTAYGPLNAEQERIVTRKINGY